eukprot:GAHX01000022.1.p1 GENE.GAHX01000022.1~~GAHX01000022.1.p1  ORF type:complete len:139 (+),score=32.60 GAHX01000022.1:44-460(+)
MAEKTLVLIKPDALRNHNCGEIITEFERAGFIISKSWFGKISDKFAKKHYEEHLEKPFFKFLLACITSGPLMALELERINAVELGRQLIGETNPELSPLGTLRRKFGKDLDNNAVHGSATVEDAKKELTLWFGDYKEK